MRLQFYIFSLFLGTNFLTSPHAYIDPNTGGMLFQLLAVIFAVFSGFLFFFSRQIKTTIARIRRSFRRSEEHISDKPGDEPGNDRLGEE